MAPRRKGIERAEYLAKIAQMYYLDNLNQSEIADRIGVTRSMISHLLAEARSSGIVQVTVNHPMRRDTQLAEALQESFKLKEVLVVSVDNPMSLVSTVAGAAAKLLQGYMQPGVIVGTSWGSAISKTIEAIEFERFMADVTVVQLIGSLSGRLQEFDAHHHLQYLVNKVGGLGMYLNAPLILESKSVAEILRNDPSIRETLEYGSRADIAVLGIGTTAKAESSFYLSGYFNEEDLQNMADDETVGDVCGHFYNIQGQPTSQDYTDRIVGISRQQLMGIKHRLGIAGGPNKVEPIIGALRGGYINMLVTDEMTARTILDQEE